MEARNMTTYKTGNKLGSTAVKDLYDNAENLDTLVNDRTKLSNPDRFGKDRKTWWGMEQDFQQFLLNSGYQDLGNYAAGIEITARNQFVWKDGELYRVGAALELPYTTTGNWTTEGDSFVAIGDQVLRQELATDTGSSMVSHGSMTVADALDTLDVPFKSDPASASTYINVSSKLRQIIMPEDYGAVADGITDDYDAFQRALAASRQYKQPLHLSKKTYFIGQPLKILSGDTIVGAGSQLTILKFGITDNMINAIGPVDGEVRTYGQKLEGLAIQNVGSARAGVALISVSSAILNDVKVYGNFSVGFEINSPTSGYAVYNRFTNCTAQAPIGFYILGTSSNANTFISCRTNLATNYGVYLVNGNDNHFINCQFEAGGTGTAVRLSGTIAALCWGNTFRSCRVEGYQGGKGWSINNTASRTVIDAPQFVADGMAAYIEDNGSGTVITSSISGVTSKISTLNRKVLELTREANGGDGSESLLTLRDTITTTGDPTMLELISTRATGRPIKLTRSGANYFAVDASGRLIMRAPDGGQWAVSIGNTGALTTVKL